MATGSTSSTQQCATSRNSLQTTVDCNSRLLPLPSRLFQHLLQWAQVDDAIRLFSTCKHLQAATVIAEFARRRFGTINWKWTGNGSDFARLSRRAQLEYRLLHLRPATAWSSDVGGVHSSMRWPLAVCENAVFSGSENLACMTAAIVRPVRSAEAKLRDLKEGTLDFAPWSLKLDEELRTEQFDPTASPDDPSAPDILELACAPAANPVVAFTASDRRLYVYHFDAGSVDGKRASTVRRLDAFEPPDGASGLCISASDRDDSFSLALVNTRELHVFSGDARLTQEEDGGIKHRLTMPSEGAADARDTIG